MEHLFDLLEDDEESEELDDLFVFDEYAIRADSSKKSLSAIIYPDTRGTLLRTSEQFTTFETEDSNEIR